MATQIIPLQYYNYICEIADNLIQNYNIAYPNQTDGLIHYDPKNIDVTTQNPYFEYNSQDPRTNHALVMYSNNYHFVIDDVITIKDRDLKPINLELEPHLNDTLHYLSQLMKGLYEGSFQIIIEGYKHYQEELNRRMDYLRHIQDEFLTQLTDNYNTNEFCIILKNKHVSMYQWQNQKVGYQIHLFDLDLYGNVIYFDKPEALVNKNLQRFDLDGILQTAINVEYILSKQSI